MDKKEKEHIREVNDLENDSSEERSDVIQDDISLSKYKNYSSSANPEDIFQYKKMRIQPESAADFPGNIDKDWVLANITGNKPNLQQKKYESGTYLLIKAIFIKSVKVPLLNSNGEQIIFNGEPVFYEGKEFDTAFQPILDYVLSGIKSELVGSRGMGPDREAVLDITTGFRKQVEKSKSENGKVMGLGG